MVERGKVMRAKKAQRPSAGFTFTISALIISLTLIAMAQFVTEWRRSGQVSMTVSSNFQSADLQQRVSSDFASMLGAKAKVEQTGSGAVQTKIGLNFPLEREGGGLGGVTKYSLFLSGSLAGSGVEAAVYPNISWSNGTAITFPDNGTLDMGNFNAYDMATYNHPAGWEPSEINITIVSDSAAQSVGQFAIQNAGVLHESITYNLVYSEVGGRTYARSATAEPEHNASLQIIYPNGTILLLGSKFSQNGQKNYTYIYYVKSPGAYLLLPFDAMPGGLQDYYGNGVQFQLGGGDTDSYPQNVSGCISGYCYEFDGINDYINASSLPLYQSEVQFRQGPNRLQNGDFESYSGTPDDQTDFDSWDYWDRETGSSHYFDATVDAHNGTYGIHLAQDPDANANLQQRVQNLMENTQYAFSFWAHGATDARYAVQNADGNWLQQDGSWGGQYVFSADASGAQYRQIEQKFTLPLLQSYATVYLYASTTADIYYDNAQLRRSEGLNGGFESYYSDWGPDGHGLLPEGH
jgi:hypothetical protein